MPYEDFLKEFETLEICYYHDDFKYNYLKVTQKKKKGKYFNLRVANGGLYFI